MSMLISIDDNCRTEMGHFMFGERRVGNWWVLMVLYDHNTPSEGKVVTRKEGVMVEVMYRIRE